MYHILTKFNQFRFGKKLFFLFVLMFLLGWNQSIAYSATTANPDFSLSYDMGGINCTLKINGSNFPSGSTGTFYFDSNNNGQKDDGEPSIGVTADNYGTVTGTLTTPNVSAGTYSVHYISNSGVVSVGYRTFTIVNPSFSLSSEKGGINCPLDIIGGNFPGRSTVTFYFDSNDNGQKDDGEPSVVVTANNYGVVTGTLTTPNVAAGTYSVRYISNSEVVSVVSRRFTIVNPNFSLSPNTGKVNSTFSIVGSNFPGGSTGTFYFDSNNNWQKDDGEPSVGVTANNYGNVTGTFTTPNIAAGTYYVHYISSSGVVNVAPQAYTIVNPSFSLSPDKGGTNCTFNINGSNFPDGGAGTFYFDSNNNGQKDDGEPSVGVTANNYGNVTGTLTTPNVAVGTYYVRYISNSGVVSVESRPYTIVNPSFSLSYDMGGINRTLGISGSNFPAGSTGTFYFDSNNNRQKDDGEPSVGVTANNYGNAAGILTTPNVAAGTYYVRYISNSGVENVESKPYKIVNPSFYLSPNTGRGNSTFSIVGINFPGGSTGTFYFDSNNNGQKDDSEPSVVVTANNYGNVTGTLITPNIAGGTYYVRYITNSGVVNVAPNAYTIVNPSFSLSPNIGRANSIFNIGGSNFPSGSTGTFYFDSNNNGQKDDGEPSIGVTADNYGSVTGTLTTPNIAGGTYYVRYISNSGIVNVESKPYTMVNPSFYLSRSSGWTNYTFNINGSNFPSGSTGTFYFDSNNNGQKDDSEPSIGVTADNYGYVFGTLTTPNVAGGTYYVRYITNSGVVNVAPNAYTIVNPSFSPSSNTGGTNCTFSINGSNFPSGSTGTFYFDSNNNGQKDNGEPSVVVTANNYENVAGILTTPNVAAGTYYVRYISNSGIVNVESKPYTIVNPSFSLSRSSGWTNYTFNIYGSNFPGGSTGTFYFDSNNNGQKDDGEPSIGVTASYYGTVTGTLTTPNIAAGTYYIRCIPTSESTTINPVPFTIAIPEMSLSVNKGGNNTQLDVKGKFLPIDSVGIVYFDSNNNGQKDNGEQSVFVAVGSLGEFNCSLTTPNIAAGTYYVRYVSTSGSTTINPVPFTIAIPEMSLSVNKGGKNTQLDVKGKFLPIGSAGIVYFDSNNNGRKDNGEPSTFVAVGSLGEFNCSLTTPNVAAGTYYVRYVSTSGSTTINPVPFTIAIPEMSLSVNKGGKNTQLEIEGKFLPIGSAGIVYFDSNNNGRKDSGEPSVFVAVGSLGEFNCSLTTPNVAAGTYYVRYISTSGSTTVNPVLFKIVNSNKTKVDNLVDYVKKNYPNADVSILNHKLTINLVNSSETLYDNYKTLINKGNFEDLLDEAQDIVLGNNNSLGVDGTDLQDYLSLLSNGIHAQYIEKQADGSYKVKTDEVAKRIRDKYATFGQLIANVDRDYGQKQVPDLKIDGYTVTKIVKVYKDKDVTIYNSSSTNKADKTVGTLLKNILPVDSLQNVDALDKLQCKDLEGIYKIYLQYNGKAINTPYIIQIKDKVKN